LFDAFDVNLKYLIVKDTVFSSEITLNCQGILHEFSNPLIMGIINTTPDSFFEDSRKNSTTEIIAQVSDFIQAGASIIDIGGYSSRPGAKDISEIEETQRVLPAIEAIRTKFPNSLISIDTFRASVAEQAIHKGANIINDISGGQANPNIFNISAKHCAPYIMMHMKGTPQNMQKNTSYKHLIKDLILFFSNQIRLAKKQGVKDIIIDPGLGFSKTLDQNYEIIAKLELFKALEQPILIGASRKSMLYNLLNISAPESLNATSIINTISLMNGANILRVHDVKEAIEAQLITSKIKAST